MDPLIEQGFLDLEISNDTVYACAAALKTVVEEGVGAALPSPSPTTPSGRVAALSLLQLRYTCGVSGDAELPPIWEEADLAKGHKGGLSTLNHTLLRGIP